MCVTCTCAKLGLAAGVTQGVRVEGLYVHMSPQVAEQLHPGGHPHGSPAGAREAPEANPLSQADIQVLLQARGADYHAVVAAADALRLRVRKGCFTAALRLLYGYFMGDLLLVCGWFMRSSCGLLLEPCAPDLMASFWLLVRGRWVAHRTEQYSTAQHRGRAGPFGKHI